MDGRWKWREEGGGVEGRGDVERRGERMKEDEKGGGKEGGRRGLEMEMERGGGRSREEGEEKVEGG